MPLLTAVFGEIKAALSPLVAATQSEPRRAELLAHIGYDADAFDIQSLIDLVTELQADYTRLETLFQHPAASLADVRSQLAQVQGVLGVIDKLKHLLEVANTVTTSLDLAKDLTVFLLGSYLQSVHPTLYAILVLLEIVEDPYEHEFEAPVVDTNGTLVRGIYYAYRLHFDQLGALLSNPAGYVAARYYPNGLPTRAAANALADKLFPRLARLFESLGLFASYGMSATDGAGTDGISYGAISDELQRHMLTVMLLRGRVVAFGFTLALSSAQDGDLGLVIAPFGEAKHHLDLANWLVEVALTGNLGGLAIGPQGVLLDGSGAFGATASVTSQPDASGNSFLFGAPQGTHLAIGEVAFKANLKADTSGGADYGVLAQATQARFVLRPEEAGGFLGAIIPAAGVAGAFDLGLGWSKGKGFYLLGSTSLKAHYTITAGGPDSLLVIRGVDVGLTAAADKLRLSATASGRVKLGPVAAELTDIGAVVNLAFPGSGGNLGVAQADVAFQLPSGVGITVASDLVNGGGYLFFDRANHKYAGAANLTLKTSAREINLNALGLLQTQLPGNPDAYSLLLLITAQFTPIDLGLGFTLSGLGGLVGVNRSASQEYLLGMVRQGELKKLLFPASVMDDPTQALALIDSAFPATEGRYVIGLMAQLGWGSAANVITLDLALLVELPAPVRLVLLGVLQAVLPSAQNDKLKLRADFLGYVDFGAKKASFDASLSDSHILNFALTGDLAFRLYQGSNPLFVVSAGGFHPAFQPPAGAGLTGLRRLRLALAQGGDLQLKLDCYFAVTANTVQFGAHLDLTYQLARSFRVEGHFGFDVLFQFSPFRVLAHVEAGVAIMRGSSELLSIHLSLDVTGPGPWHIWGEASFKIWFIKIGVNVNATIGATVSEPALPAPDVHALLVQALNDPASWQVEAPSAKQPASVLLRPVVAAGQVVLDPRGALSLRQRVAPLGLVIDKYGSAPTLPRNGRQFELTELRVGQAAYAAGAKGRAEVRDFFVPDQFTTLTDAQKLSAPSFQQLPNGVRIGSLDGLVAAPRATRRIIEYERKDLLSGASGGSTRFGLDTFRQLGRGSALGQAVLAAQPSGRAAPPVGWQDDTYEVVLAETLGAYPSAALAPPPFASQAEAEQYRQQQPAPASLLVVASYELATA